MKTCLLRLILAFLICLPQLVMAQNINVSGKVVDSDNGEPLIGANIILKGTSTGTVTDLDGNFTLDVEKSSTLVVSFTGYESTEVVVETAILNIELRSDTELLGELVVVGYGKQEKKVATGSIAKVTAEDIEGIKVPDLQSTLEGQVTGLIVNESSGQPGAAKSLLIRGVSTNGDNSPLFIVDGLQVNTIDNINPGDIASIDILKDAASTAIYGARAANGAVIITTKKGKDEDGGSITYEGFTSVSNPWRMPEMMNADQYVEITREKFANSNQLSALETLNFPQAGDATNNTDWMNEIFEPAILQNHRVSATTRNAFISLEFWDQNGVIGGEKSNYRRYALRFNSDKKINEFLKVGENVFVNRTENNNLGVNNAFGSVLSDAFAYDPLTPANDPNAQFGFGQSEWVQNEYINPLSRIFLANQNGHADQVQGNVFAEITPFEGLTIRTDVGLEATWFKYRFFTPEYAFTPAQTTFNNVVGQGAGFNQSIQFENYATYRKTFREIHNFDVVVGTSYRSSIGEEMGGSTFNVPEAVQFNENWQYLNAGTDSTDLTFGFAPVDYRLISYFARAQYNIDKKYLFTATIRRDGSSNFGANNRFGIFPSFSAGWVISKEKFFNVRPIDYLKFKASWGRNGNDRIQPLSFAATIENVFTYAFGTNPSLEQGAALATPPNPNIKWEESEQIDVGFEMDLFDGRMNIEADYYRKTTKDLLMAELIPGYIGATNNPISNLGEIRNQGVELGVGYRFKINDWRLNTRLNYTHFRNTVVEVAGETGFLQGWNWPVRNTAITRLTEGFPVAHFVGYITDGIFQSEADVFAHINGDGDLLQPNAQPGDFRFIDTNGDGEINSDDITNIGSPWPDHIFGLSISGDYKGFDFSCIFSAQLGHDIYRTYERQDITFTNYQTFWMDRWTEENPSNELPRLVSNDANNNQRPSDFYVEDASFLRLRNLQLGYTIPNRLTRKAKLQKVRVYFTAQNLLTITAYRGFDPDIGTNDWILDTGIDKGFYPANQAIGGGLSVTF